MDNVTSPPPMPAYDTGAATDWSDWCVLVIGVLVTAVLLATAFALRWREEVTIHGLFRLHDPPTAIVSLVFGLVHAWSTFIAQDHFAWPDWVGRTCCVCWSPWVQLGLGLQPVGCLLVLRLLARSHAFLMIARQSALHWRLAKLGAVVIGEIPLVIALSIVTGIRAHADGDTATGTLIVGPAEPCPVIPRGEAAFETAWFAAWAVACWIGTWTMEERAEHASDYRTIRHLVIAFGVYVIVWSSMDLTDAAGTTTGRAVITLGAFALHAFMFYRTIGLRWSLCPCALSWEQRYRGSVSSRAWVELAPYTDTSPSGKLPGPEPSGAAVLPPPHLQLSAADAIAAAAAAERIFPSTEERLLLLPPGPLPQQPFLDYCARQEPFDLFIGLSTSWLDETAADDSAVRTIVHPDRAVACYTACWRVRHGLALMTLDTATTEIRQLALLYAGDGDNYVPMVRDLLKPTLAVLDPQSLVHGVGEDTIDRLVMTHVPSRVRDRAQAVRRFDAIRATLVAIEARLRDLLIAQFLKPFEAAERVRLGYREPPLANAAGDKQPPLVWDGDLFVPMMPLEPTSGREDELLLRMAADTHHRHDPLGVVFPPSSDATDSMPARGPPPDRHRPRLVLATRKPATSGTVVPRIAPPPAAESRFPRVLSAPRRSPALPPLPAPNPGEFVLRGRRASTDDILRGSEIAHAARHADSLSLGASPPSGLPDVLDSMTNDSGPLILEHIALHAQQTPASSPLIARHPDAPAPPAALTVIAASAQLQRTVLLTEPVVRATAAPLPPRRADGHTEVSSVSLATDMSMVQ